MSNRKVMGRLIGFDDHARRHGASALVALLQEAQLMRDRRIGSILTGGNVAREVFAHILAEHAKSYSTSCGHPRNVFDNSFVI